MKDFNQSTALPEPTDSYEYPDIPCNAGEFDCGESICLDSSVRCNLDPECPDGSDEASCDNFTRSKLAVQSSYTMETMEQLMSFSYVTKDLFQPRDT